MKILIESSLIQQEIEELALISEVEAPAVTRVVFSEQDLKARDWLIEKLRAAGLSVRIDAVGNTFARWQGSREDLAPVATGSHIDAIPHAGRFDGVVGVLGGLESIRALQRGGFRPIRSIDLIQFTAEEPTRFGIGCLGSRLLSGALTSRVDNELVDSSGETLLSVRTKAGFSGDLQSVSLAPGTYSAFIELHIEQGPLLEREALTIGQVTAISAPSSFRIIVEGDGGHAGATLMSGRRDALCAAAEIILSIESLASNSGAADTVGTVGICEVHPGAINSIPSRVQLGVDLRDIDGERRDRVLRGIEASAQEIGRRRSVEVRIEMLNADAPATSSSHILRAIETSCEEAKVKSRKMVSRAYHDSLFMSRIARTAMIFIPCRDGISHRPDEYAKPADIASGVEVLARTLAKLSASPE
jgi:N-carbamoyl-L-amino-acid hydrolase